MINTRGVSAKKEIPIVLSILVLVILGVWYGWHHHNQKQLAKNTLPAAGWARYQSQKYGFQFIYPKAWGPVTVLSVPHQTGFSYTINFGFKPQTTAKSPYADLLAIKMDSDNASSKFCNAKNRKECFTEKAYTKVDVSKALSGDKRGFVKYDSSSFAVYDYSSESSLKVNQIINLPNIKVSAAKAEYQRFSQTIGCPIDKLQPTVKAGCIGLSEYNQIKQLLDSFQPLI